MSFYDYIVKRIPFFAFFVLTLIPRTTSGQSNILDTELTFREGIVKTGNALDIISHQTGYYFTYDSKIIDTERKVTLTFNSVKLSAILDNILRNDSLRYSTISKYIIIYRTSPSTKKTPESEDWDVRLISGMISDYESGEPLPYATIGIASKGKGTVTNNNGEFGLKITRDCLDDSLSVSYVGYFNRKIPVRQALENNFTIRMIREYISIPEIIIRNQAPQEIMRKAYEAISKNYGNSPASMMAFYREAVMKKQTLQTYSEAILQIYKSAYTSTFFRDQIKILKSRKLENIGLKDTLTIRLKAGLSSTLELDGIKNLFEFLVPENFYQYNYRMIDIVTIDDESAYVIEFSQKSGIDYPLFKGELYINLNDFGIFEAKLELNPELIQKTRGNFVSNNARGYSTWPVSIKYTVGYRKINGRYFLNHVRGDLEFNAKKKRRIFSIPFDVFFEIAITDINLENVTRFDREELAPIYSVFARTITDYDPDFWGDQDFLKPEDNLLQELKNMKVKLQQFEKK